MTKGAKLSIPKVIIAILMDLRKFVKVEIIRKLEEKETIIMIPTIVNIPISEDTRPLPDKDMSKSPIKKKTAIVIEIKIVIDTSTLPTIEAKRDMKTTNIVTLLEVIVISTLIITHLKLVITRNI